MEDEKNGKISRVLSLYTKLINGETINKADAANLYGVNERSIQRDISDIRYYLETNYEYGQVAGTILYERDEKSYRLEKVSRHYFSNSEVLAICKILLDSRAFTKNEMSLILDKLLWCCVADSKRNQVKELIQNEEYHYVEPRHKTVFIDTMWEIGQAIMECRYIEIDYYRTKDKSVVKRKLKPAAIMFSEYYFYLTAFIDDKEIRENFDVINDSFPTIYRMDRIRNLNILDERFHTPYRDRFEEGEFRKRIQFMYGGRLQKIKFQYSGPDIDAILDRLPTAVILDEQDRVYTLSAEVFGKGIDMWLRSQGEYVQKITDEVL